MQQAKHLVQRPQLFGRAGILEFVVCRETSDALVADSDAVRIEVLHVTALDCNRTTIVQRAVATNIDMISRIIPETSCPVAGLQFLDGEVLVGARVGAVEDDQVNPPG